MKKKSHYNIVHQSLILDATIGGIKVQWIKFLGLAGLLGFSLTGGGLFSFIGVPIILWIIKTFILEPIYDYDPLAIDIIGTSVLFQDEFYQSHADINAPGVSDNKSIPDIRI